MERHLDAAREISRAHAGCENEPLLAAGAFDRRGQLPGLEGCVLLIEVAGLREMFGEQLLDMGRALQWRDQLGEPRGDFGNQYIGEVAAGLFRGLGGSDFGRERVLVQPFDDGAEQRFLGFEMMIQRLPR